jgi:hypothetical protein
MKKILAMIALALFLGGISASAVAASYSSTSTVVLSEDEKKGEDNKEAKKSEATSKSGECTKTGEAKKSDCSKTCEGESKE